jgi:adenylate cyclase
LGSPDLSFFNELKRRNVFRVGIAYAVVGWLLIEVASVILPTFKAPEWVMQVFVSLVVLGFPLALIFAWAFELTPDGVKRESEVDRTASIRPKTGKKLDRVIIGVLIVALAYMGFDKLVLDPSRDAELVEATRQAVAEEGADQSIEPAVTEDIAPSIAVLPLVNMSDDPSNEYFSDGISEELLNLLAKIPELRVTSRSSAFTFKNQNLEIPEIAKRLNVAHILDGSVRKSGNQVRITVQLIEAQSDTHLWSDTYDRTLDDIFAIQDEIAATVVTQLKIKLLGAAPTVQKTDTTAYELVLQARHLANQVSADVLGAIIDLYRRALEIDPEYSTAWGELSVVLGQQRLNGQKPIDQIYAEVREAATRALSIDPDNAMANASMAEFMLLYDHQLAEGSAYIKKALELGPTDPTVLKTAWQYLRALNRYEDALAVTKYLVRTEPEDSVNHANQAWSYWYLKRMDEAVNSFYRVLKLSPDSALAHFGIGAALIHKSELAAALDAMQKEPGENWRLLGLALVYEAMNRRDLSDASLTELIEKYGNRHPSQVAWIFSRRAEYDSAFEWLAKGVALKEPELPVKIHYITRLPDLSGNLQADPRYLPFLESIGLSPAQRDAIELTVTLPD